MGDLNDDPIDESVTDFLKASGKLNKLNKDELYNPYVDKYKDGNGTLAYNDAWNLFDQIIFTQSFLGDDKSSYKYHSSKIFKRKYMFQDDGKYKGYPLRTYVGNTFMGGFSDHFPVYIFIVKEPQ